MNSSVLHCYSFQSDLPYHKLKFKVIPAPSSRDGIYLTWAGIFVFGISAQVIEDIFLLSSFPRFLFKVVLLRPFAHWADQLLVPLFLRGNISQQSGVASGWGYILKISDVFAM
jgi:hypothetical protein